MHWYFFNTGSQLDHIGLMYNTTHVPVWIIYHCFLFAVQDENPLSMIVGTARMEFLIYMIKIRRTQEKTHCCSIGLLSFQKIMFESTRLPVDLEVSRLHILKLTVNLKAQFNYGIGYPWLAITISLTMSRGIHFETWCPAFANHPTFEMMKLCMLQYDYGYSNL